MPYREKIAWLYLTAMVVCFGPYFAVVGAGTFQSDSLPNLRQLGFYAIVAGAMAVIMLVGHAVMRRQSPDEARLPPDERDRTIMYRSMTIAYYVLIVGTILVGIVMPFTSGGWTIINAAIFMIIAAEIVHYGVVVVSYRKHA